MTNSTGIDDLVSYLACFLGCNIQLILDRTTKATSGQHVQKGIVVSLTTGWMLLLKFRSMGDFPFRWNEFVVATVAGYIWKKRSRLATKGAPECSRDTYK